MPVRVWPRVPFKDKYLLYNFAIFGTVILQALSLSSSHIMLSVEPSISILPGKSDYILWKIGVIRFWQRFMLKNYNSLKAKSQIALKENILRN